MSDPSLPADEPSAADLEARERATTALQAAFSRLAPQGSDAWNFLAAFTHLGDRYGPYQPGASALSKQLGDAEKEAPGSRFRRKRTDAAGRDPTELESAMAQVVEAFRFLSARVQTLEERLARQDRPVEGAAWLVPAEELGDLVAPVTSHLLKTAAKGEVVHGDCGQGALLRALGDAGVDATGVEPRGTVALGALEQGSKVVIAELFEDLATRPEASLGAVVMSGVVDRLPLHVLLRLLDQAHRTLALGAPLVVVTADQGSEEQWGPQGVDLIDARPLHSRTWELLLQQAGFVEIALLETTSASGRRVLTASTPT